MLTKKSARPVPLLLVLLLLQGCLHPNEAWSASASEASAFPLPLELHVPFEPTAYPSAGRTYLTYELYLRNFGGTPLTLSRIEVFAEDTSVREPLAGFEGEQIEALLQAVGDQDAVDGSIGLRRLDSGSSKIVFLSIALADDVLVPDKLRHRVVTDGGAVEGAVVGTHNTELKALGPPLSGRGWTASGGPDNDAGHRRGTMIFEGRAQISRRYAMDWVKVENGAAFSGDRLDNRSYHAYGKPVLAVADGTVISALDGFPENVPEGAPAIPMALETVAGNTLTLDLGGGQFARYMHLRTGSLRVTTGDLVRRGQVLALVGNSGDSRRPHLHFEVTTAPDLLGGEGVPYLIDEFVVTATGDDAAGRHRNALPMPLDGKLFSFEEVSGAAEGSD